MYLHAYLFRFVIHNAVTRDKWLFFKQSDKYGFLRCAGVVCERCGGGRIIVLFYIITYYLFCANKGTMRLRAECGRARARLGGIIIIIIPCVYRGKASRTRRHRRRAGCITSVISVGGGRGGRVCKGG